MLRPSKSSDEKNSAVRISAASGVSKASLIALKRFEATRASRMILITLSFMSEASYRL